MILFALLILVAPAGIAAQGAPSSAPATRAGYAHCETVEALLEQNELLRAKNIRTWQNYVTGDDACHVSTAWESVMVWGRIEVEGRTVLCLLSREWWGCHYAFAEAVYLPSKR